MQSVCLCGCWWTWNRKQQQRCETARAFSLSDVSRRPWTFFSVTVEPFFSLDVFFTKPTSALRRRMSSMRCGEKKPAQIDFYFGSITNLISSNVFTRVNWINRRRISRCKHFNDFRLINIFHKLYDWCSRNFIWFSSLVKSCHSQSLHNILCISCLLLASSFVFRCYFSHQLLTNKYHLHFPPIRRERERIVGNTVTGVRIHNRWLNSNECNSRVTRRSTMSGEKEHNEWEHSGLVLTAQTKDSIFQSMRVVCACAWWLPIRLCLTSNML